MMRRATAEDGDAIAGVMTASRAAQPWYPPIHNAVDDRCFVREHLLPTHDTWVFDKQGRVVGFAALQPGVLGHIYVHPDVQGRGTGTALLEHAQHLLPEGFSLWTHQASEACRFYESRGLVAVERTDGSTTAEKIPDVKFAWRPADR